MPIPRLGFEFRRHCSRIGILLTQQHRHAILRAIVADRHPASFSSFLLFFTSFLRKQESPAISRRSRVKPGMRNKGSLRSRVKPGKRGTGPHSCASRNLLQTKEIPGQARDEEQRVFEIPGQAREEGDRRSRVKHGLQASLFSQLQSDAYRKVGHQHQAFIPLFGCLYSKLADDERPVGR